MNIFYYLLDTNDIVLIDLTCETFIVFNNYYDGSTLGIDNQFTENYERLLNKFSYFCNHEDQLEMKYIGQRGIQSAISSQALLSSNFMQQLNIVLPPIMDTLTDDNKPQLNQLNNEAIDIRESALNNDKLDDAYIQAVASHTLSILFSKLTGHYIRMSVTSLLDYINKNDKWTSNNINTTMVIVIEHIHSQYKHVFVSEILQRLSDEDMMSNKQVSLVSILDTVMNTHTLLLGLSVIEALNSIFNLLVKAAGYNTEDKQRNKTIQQGLIHSIGGLSLHKYYENQLNDMADYLTSKLRPSTALVNLTIHDYQCLVLSCLDNLYDLSLDSFIPSFDLLADKDPKTRLMICKSLYRHLLSSSSPPLSFLSLNSLLYAMHDWILVSNLNMTDIRFFYAFLCIINHIWNMQATLVILSLVFKIQPHPCVSVQSMLIYWLRTTSDFYHIQPLTEYTNQLLESSFVLNLTEDVSNIESIEDLPKTSHPSTIIDRDRVIDIMSNDESLRDVYGLEAGLLTEFDLKKPMDNKIHLIQGPDKDSKPKLSSPWEHSSITLKSPKPSSVKVSTLKQVLATQSTPDDSTQSSTSSSSSLNAFLTRLSPPLPPQSKANTLSLVNPPY
ncbi:hypothetical protein G6F57_005991 [Rhizopus arrhizus]|nr:hypothetical protein G6F23_008445 [Rhizopus arrhizus]KAG0792494.1 hypothetical protein G6F21_004314 [Rhizopus arrhizus]KAG0853867.1 hypothetical protein G6F17_006846 [Rhizopus arrhizus]KAG0886162.1 hypothetical protein G6F15_003599 [Rhizopus arrhizus]KAG0939786.1 hypothetical protein G6F30_007087 [Rhizopus arrhizus]